MSHLKTLLIVYHSMTGGTQQMAQAAARGARGDAAVRVSLLSAGEALEADVLEASGFVFASPEYLGGMSGSMKDFFDRTYYAALDRLNGRPYATLICAGSDGRNAAAQIQRIALGWRLEAIAPPIIVCTHAQKPADILRIKHIAESDLRQCEELGAALAAGCEMGIF